jgi:predicted secreted hydrolase
MAQLRLGSVLGETSLEGYQRAVLPRLFEFPADHGPHPGYRSEWWYLTLNLTDGQGDDFGVQFTVFRQAVTPEAVSANPWQSNQIYLAHLALTDVASGRHQEFERMARGHPALAGAQAAPFAVWLEDWVLKESEAGHWQLNVKAGELDLTLALQSEKSPLLQGDSGLSRKGLEQASYYYSLPRLAVDGVLQLAGRDHQVTGYGWFDREWSTSVLGQDQVGWDWFALQFNDDTEFMGFQLRRVDGARDGFDAAVRVAADGAARKLGPEQFSLKPLRYWIDEEGVEWPVEWQLELADENWRVVAAIDDQRMDTLLVYWEGLVYVYDRQQRQIGRGYMELTGYHND